MATKPLKDVVAVGKVPNQLHALRKSLLTGLEIYPAEHRRLGNDTQNLRSRLQPEQWCTR